jgi:hypothetical protein
MIAAYRLRGGKSITGLSDVAQSPAAVSRCGASGEGVWVLNILGLINLGSGWQGLGLTANNGLPA